MVAVRVLVFLAGLTLVAWTLLSAIRTVILPRNAQSIISRTVFRALALLFGWLANERRTFEARDRTWALFAPIGLAMLPGVWLTLTTLGYTLMFFALDTRSLGDAFHLSGSSVTTLGFSPADTLAERILAFTEAGFGLFLVALMITYLPALYSAFSERETMVALMEVRAGTPPSAVEFLLRHHRIGWLEELDETWLEWERFFASIEESHTTYPAVAFFRSPEPSRSWVTAAGTVLDTASLMLSCVRVGTPGPPGVCIRAGYISLRRIAGSFGIEFDPDPHADDPISVTRSEFDEAWDVLAGAGLALVDDRDRAWSDFSGWRVNYDTVLLSLAEVLRAPYAPWTADRSAVGYRRPRLRRFGKREAGRTER